MGDGTFYVVGFWSVSGLLCHWYLEVSIFGGGFIMDSLTGIVDFLSLGRRSSRGRNARIRGFDSLAAGDSIVDLLICGILAQRPIVWGQ